MEAEAKGKMFPQSDLKRIQGTCYICRCYESKACQENPQSNAFHFPLFWNFVLLFSKSLLRSPYVFVVEIAYKKLLDPINN